MTDRLQSYWNNCNIFFRKSSHLFRIFCIILVTVQFNEISVPSGALFYGKGRFGLNSYFIGQILGRILNCEEFKENSVQQDAAQRNSA